MEQNKNLDIFDTNLDRFLRGKMSAEEEKSFKHVLSTNPGLRERAKATALLIREMQQTEVKNDRRIINTISSMDEQDFLDAAGVVKDDSVTKKNPVILKPFIPRLIKYAAAACVVGVLFFGGYRYYDLSQAQILSGNLYGNYELYIDGDFKGGDTGDIEINLESIFSNVRQGIEINKAITYLESFSQDAYNYNSDYYEYRNDIAWNLAMAYLKEGKRKQAINSLNLILDDNDTKQAVKDQIIETIERIR